MYIYNMNIQMDDPSVDDSNGLEAIYWLING